ncbi:hypothetical protein Unana1_00267 [Umbelopsis nana]
MSSSDVLGTPVAATRRPCLSQEKIDSTSKRKKMNGDARQSQSYDTIEHKNAPDSSNTVPDKLACLKGRGQLGQDSGPAASNRVNKLSEFADKVRRMHEEIDAWAMMTLSKGIEEAPRKVTAMEQDYMDWCEEQKTLAAEDSIETSSLRPKERIFPCVWTDGTKSAPLQRLVSYANDPCNKPILYSQLCELMTTVDSFYAVAALQSDVTWVIAPMLRALMERILVEGAKSSPTECKQAITMIDDLHDLLQAEYHWSPDEYQFTGPFDHVKFAEELMRLSRTSLLLTKRRSIWKHVKLNKTEVASSSIELHHTHKPLGGPEEQSIMRQIIEEAFATPHPVDNLDSIWSDDEEQDQFDTESESDDTADERHLFDSATEVSAADVTDSDWSMADIDLNANGREIE